MKAKHIVQVSAYYPPHLGGQENVVQGLAHALLRAGHEVSVLASAIGASEHGLRNEDGVRVHRMRGSVFGHAPIMPFFPLTLFRVARPGGVVHVHIGQAFTPEMVWLVSKLRRFKYIAELHIDFEPSGPAGVLLPLYKRLVLGRVLRASDSIIVLNDKTLRTVRETYGYTGNVKVMSNGIDEAYFTLNRPVLALNPPQFLHLLFVGRLSHQKNIGALLDALKLTNRNVHLDIVGDGEERELVEKTIAEHGLKNVTLHGRLGGAEVMAFYETCDALVMPSLYEAQPLVLLEAMAARIPIIGTNVIGVADHIKDVGIIVEPTAAGLAEGIEQYYAQYSSLPKMVLRGANLAEKFRWKHALKEYEALYETVLEA